MSSYFLFLKKKKKRYKSTLAGPPFALLCIFSPFSFACGEKSPKLLKKSNDIILLKPSKKPKNAGK